MSHITKTDIEAARHEIWLMYGGPARETARHHEMAIQSLEVLKQRGYRIISQELVKEPFEEIKRLECVVRIEDSLFLIKWHPHNHGFMCKTNSCGWVQFEAKTN